MIPRVLVASADMPDGGGEIRLLRHGADFSIMLGRIELMNSRMSGSEEALAALTCARLTSRAGPRLLIGGLGMGFTLRAALAQTGKDADLVVAELVPAVIAWAHGPLAPLFGDSLADRRVTVVEDDVGALIRSAREAYDSILLDVDNGPDALTRKANDWLYAAKGLEAARSALRPGGILAIWSAYPDRVFAERLRRARFAVEEIKVRARQGRGAHHIIWLATKSGPARGQGQPIRR
jgi:spermidine synthase